MKLPTKLTLALPFVALCLIIFALFAMRLLVTPLVSQIYGGCIILILLVGVISGLIALRTQWKPALVGIVLNSGFLFFLIFFTLKAIHNIQNSIVMIS